MNREEMDRELLAQPVRGLQYMLRQLAGRYPVLPELAVDGIFGERTLEAVMIFQREFHPPVTGVVDRPTWNAIRDRWLAAEADQALPRALRALPDGDIQVLPGDAQAFLGVPQAMFQMLGRYFIGIHPHPVDAVHGSMSADNIRWLQRAAGQAETGVMDRRAWEMLSRLYEAAVVGEAPPAGRAAPGGWG